MENKTPIFKDLKVIKANEIDIQITEWKGKVTESEEFFADKELMHFSKYITDYDTEIKRKIENEEIIILCTVVNIPYQARKINNEKFIFWDISDLKGTQSRLFLTGDVCESVENEKEGSVIALVNPTLKEKDPQYYNSTMLEISTVEQLKVLGITDGLASCKGKTRKGTNCKMMLYTPVDGFYCKYHVKQDRSKKKKKKEEEGEAEEEGDETTKHKEPKESKEPKEKKVKKNKKEGDDVKKDADEAKDKDPNIKEDEYFDVESIIGMFAKKEVVKDKKKKMEMVNNRIKELDDYVKLNKPSAFELLEAKKEEAKQVEDSSSKPTKTASEIMRSQCPELINLIQKTNKPTEEEIAKPVEKTEEEKNKEVENSITLEEKQRKRFENFMNKLIELQRSRDEEDVRTLIKGLVYATNNFSFHIKHIENSNLFDICYKLMDHRSEEVAIAALKFKRRINKEYIDYYRNKRRRTSLQGPLDSLKTEHVRDEQTVEQT